MLCIFSYAASKSLRNVGVYLLDYTLYTPGYNNFHKRVLFKKSLPDLSSALRHLMQKKNFYECNRNCCGLDL